LAFFASVSAFLLSYAALLFADAFCLAISLSLFAPSAFCWAANLSASD